MYTVKRSNNQIKTEMKVVDTDNQEYIMHVNLHVEDVLAQYNNLRRLLGEAERQVKEQPNEDSYQQLANVIVSLIRLIFGDEQTSKLIDIYENRNLELLFDVVPFITSEIQPAINKAVEERAKAYNIE